MSPVDLSNSPHKLGVKFNGRALLGNGCRKYPLVQCDRSGEPYGSCVVWVKKYTLARFKSIRIAALSVMSKLFVRRILRSKYRLWWYMFHGILLSITWLNLSQLKFELWIGQE